MPASIVPFPTPHVINVFMIYPTDIKPLAQSFAITCKVDANPQSAEYIVILTD